MKCVICERYYCVLNVFYSFGYFEPLQCSDNRSDEVFGGHTLIFLYRFEHLKDKIARIKQEISGLKPILTNQFMDFVIEMFLP